MGITSNYGQFKHALDGTLSARKQREKDIVMGVSIQALSDLQVMSPVDTGRFRAGHILTVDQPSGNVPPQKSEGQKGGASSEYTSMARENLSQAESELDRAMAGDRFVVYITNNVEYGIFIENGSYSKDPNAPRALYATVRDRTEQRMNQAIGKI